jgi:hypothetical protein
MLPIVVQKSGTGSLLAALRKRRSIRPELCPEIAKIC